MVKYLVIVYMLLCMSVTANGQEGVLRVSDHHAPQQYQRISLWARYCEAAPGWIRESCEWKFITDNVFAADVVGPMWTTGVACVMQAPPFIAQFIEQNPGYKRGYFERWRCYPNDERPPLDA